MKLRRKRGEENREGIGKKWSGLYQNTLSSNNEKRK